MSAFNPATFTLPKPKTLELGQGWRAATTTGPGGQWVVVGQRGVVGCATVRRNGEDDLSIAYYLETPETIAQAIKDGPIPFPVEYDTYHDYPGVGLKIIQRVRTLRWGVVGV
jgi:hypothetical protein